MILLIVIAASIATCSSPLPTATLAPTNTARPSATLTPSTTPSAIPTATDTPGSEWHGEWMIYINGKEGEWDGSGIFSVAGETIRGEFAVYDPKLGSLYYVFSGTLDATGLIAEGEWELNRGGSGSYSWQLLVDNLDQFVGNLENGTYQFCGWRNGTERPSPCKWP